MTPHILSKKVPDHLLSTILKDQVSKRVILEFLSFMKLFPSLIKLVSDLNPLALIEIFSWNDKSIQWDQTTAGL